MICTRATLVVAVVLLAGCGPTLPLEVTVRQPSVDVLYGAPDASQPTRPPGSSIDNTTAPGLVAAPVRLRPQTAPEPRGAVPSTAPPTTRPGAPPTCPRADPFATPAQEAPISVAAPPVAGLYTFRRVGSVKATEVGGTDAELEALPARPLSPQVQRVVTNVKTAPTPAGPRITYDVIEYEDKESLRTTTTYDIDPYGTAGVSIDGDSDPGVRITRIVSDPGDGTGPRTFNPQPALKIIDLPLKVQAAQANRVQQSSRGTDPLTGASMEVFRRTLPRKSVDVCGSVVDTWRIQIGSPDDPSRQSTYTAANGRVYQFHGEIAFAPQVGMIIADDFTFGGPGRLNLESGGRRFSQTSASTINATRPR